MSKSLDFFSPLSQLFIHIGKKNLDFSLTESIAWFGSRLMNILYRGVLRHSGSYGLPSILRFQICNPTRQHPAQNPLPLLLSHKPTDKWHLSGHQPSSNNLLPRKTFEMYIFIALLLMAVRNSMPGTLRQNGMAQCFMVRPHKKAARATCTA